MKSKKIVSLLLGLAVSATTAFALTACQNGDSAPQGGGEIPAVVEHTVTFNADNGTGSTTQTVAEGKLVTAPAAPEKDRYTFDGWYNGEKKWNFESDTVDGDTTLTAKWTAKEYSVKFVDADGEEVETKTYTCENVDGFTAPEVPAAPEHYTNGAWDKEPAEYLTYSEETVVVAAKYERIMRTVTFVNDGATVSAEEVGDGLSVAEPTALTKEHYTFDGWYNGEEKWDFESDTVDGDTTLTAKWTAKEYSVKFVDANGEEVETKTYTCENVDGFTAPEVPAAPEHYTNGAWDKEPAEYLTYSEETVVVAAKYERIMRTVTFVNDGATVSAEEVGDGLSVAEPTALTKEHYTFDGWYNGEKKWNFESDTVDGDTTLTAKWTAKEYSVKFVNADGEEVETKTYTCENVDGFTAPEVPAAPEHYTNGAWDKEPAEYLTYSEETVVVTAKYERIMRTVTFVNDGATVSTEEVGDGLSVAEPTALTKEHYTFDGWYNGEEKWNFESDTVDGDTTLTAKWIAIEYSVRFVGFDEESTELKYTCENVGSFTLPEVPAAPAHYENARWDKSLAEITVYSEVEIVVTAIADKKVYSVSFANADVQTQNVVYGETMTAVVPTLDGYIFKEWLLGGKPYDVTAPIDDNITLVASWYKIVSGVKSEISATYIHDNSAVNVAISSIDAVKANPNASWYFDSDFVVDWKDYEERQLNEGLTFGINPDSEGKGYVILPKLNYTHYSKVDFGFYIEDSSSTLNMSVNGQGFTHLKSDGQNLGNKLVSIITDGTGTYMVTREVNSGDVDTARIELPAKVVNGEEGLKIDFVIADYVRIFITEFHVTSRVTDYKAVMEDALAELPTDLNDLTGSAAEAEASQSYVAAETYLTDYEKVGYRTPEIIVACKDKVLTKAVVNADGGSAAQYEAIENFRQFSETLSSEEKESEWHTADVAEVNAIIDEYFVEKSKELILMNDPSVDTSRGAVDDGERIQTEWGYHHTAYKTSYETYIHMMRFTTESYDSTVTLPKVNYNSYKEIYFGLFVNNGGNGTITIGSGSFTFTASTDHYYKIVIKDGVLTMTDDSQNDADGGATVLTATLSENVLNGTEGLVIDFDFDAYSQAEITEMHVTTNPDNIPKAELILENDPSVDTSRGAADCGERIQTEWGGHHTAYNTSYETYVHMMQFSSSDYAGTVTLPKVNYNSYKEIYFGLFAVTTNGTGKITIGDKTFSFDSSKEHYFKVSISDGVLTMTDDSKSSADGGATVITVALSENVLNGTEGLVIDFDFDAWSQAEITEMHVIKAFEKIS